MTTCSFAEKLSIVPTKQQGPIIPSTDEGHDILVKTPIRAFLWTYIELRLSFQKVIE